ncbi:MAG: 7-carboxy-7-deazaguanine synthase QueE [Myxococcota bacterium]
MATESVEPVRAASGDDASLIEVFTSAQGEGPEVGRSTVFVRFGGCDLRCRWCDSPSTWRPSERCRIEVDAGGGVFTERLNPIAISELVEIAIGLAPSASTWISLTGGEPLLQPVALSALAEQLVARGRRVYLETHGLHADALADCVEHLALVSMDWKLASDVIWGPGNKGRSGDDFHEAHEAFLRVARRAEDVYVKVVLTPNSQVEEFDEMIDRIVSVSRGITLVLQPVTPMGGIDARPSPEQLLVWLTRAEHRLSDVRLIPQTHPIYGVR